MLSNLGGWHLLVILAVVLLLFGAARLPALSRGLGQSIRIFRREVTNLDGVTADELDEGGPVEKSASAATKLL
jgi:sec-independent protein translocase protein TatA